MQPVARYRKLTGSGGDFTLDLFLDGTLREWETATPSVMWTGTWERPPVKVETHVELRTVINGATNDFIDGESIERPSGVKVRLTLIPVD